MKKLLFITGTALIIAVVTACVVFVSLVSVSLLCPLPDEQSVCHSEDQPSSMQLATHSRVEADGATAYFRRETVCKCVKTPKATPCR